MHITAGCPLEAGSLGLGQWSSDRIFWMEPVSVGHGLVHPMTASRSEFGILNHLRGNTHKQRTEEDGRGRQAVIGPNFDQCAAWD